MVMHATALKGGVVYPDLSVVCGKGSLYEGAFDVTEVG